jgi:hypothetical protein
MDRTPVDSTIMTAVGYDAATETLEIEFLGGRIYQYDSVPASVADWFLRVPAKGSYFNRKIKDVYPYRDVTPPDPDAPPLIDQLQATLERMRPPE